MLGYSIFEDYFETPGHRTGNEVKQGLTSLATSSAAGN